jgi:hypothetical protein
MTAKNQESKEDALIERYKCAYEVANGYPVIDLWRHKRLYALTTQSVGRSIIPYTQLLAMAERLEQRARADAGSEA